MPWSKEKRREYDRIRHLNRVYTPDMIEARVKRQRQLHHYNPRVSATTLTRVCCECGEEKLNQEFNKHHSKQCKVCCRFHSRRVRALRIEHPPPAAGGSCPVCKNEVERWALDHCHISGQFRGWICGRCNTGIGMLRDDLDTLKRAVQYIENWINEPSESRQCESVQVNDPQSLSKAIIDQPAQLRYEATQDFDESWMYLQSTPGSEVLRAEDSG